MDAQLTQNITTIALDCTLLDPFFLIPMGYLFMAISIIIGLVVSIVSFYCDTKKNICINSMIDINMATRLLKLLI